MIVCSAGQYYSSGACHDCPGGQYTSQEGALSCDTCLAGTHSDSGTKSTSCIDCVPLSWSQNSEYICHWCTTGGIVCDATNGGALSW